MAFYFGTGGTLQRNTQLEGTVVNLTAELAINRDRLHEDRFTPAVFVDPDLFGTRKTKLPVLPLLTANWKVLRRAWSLSLQGKKKIAERFTSQYRYFFDEEFDPDLNSQIFNFSSFFLVPKKYTKVIPIFELLRNVQRSNSEEFIKFMNYWTGEYNSRFSKRYLDLFSSFISNLDALYPILLYLRMEKEFDTDLVPSSFDFDNAKTFYGDTFELLADVFVLPCCINNLSLGRKYDEFETMNLAKFLSIDKANRANPFKGNPVLSFLAEEFESGIRNASHHGNMELSETKDQVIYSHGKPPKKHRMSVTDYLVACSRAFLSALSILEVGLMLVEHQKSGSGKIGA